MSNILSPEDEIHNLFMINADIWAEDQWTMRMDVFKKCLREYGESSSLRWVKCAERLPDTVETDIVFRDNNGVPFVEHIYWNSMKIEANDEYFEWLEEKEESKDLAQWLKEDGVPETKKILEELKKMNEEKEAVSSDSVQEDDGFCLLADEYEGPRCNRKCQIESCVNHTAASKSTGDLVGSGKYDLDSLKQEARSRDKKNYVASGTKNEETSVASHSSAAGNSTEQFRRLLYEVKETIGCHYYAARNDKDYPMECDLEEINGAVKKLQSMLNSEEDVQASVATESEQSGEAGNINSTHNQ